MSAQREMIQAAIERRQRLKQSALLRLAPKPQPAKEPEPELAIEPEPTATIQNLPPEELINVRHLTRNYPTLREIINAVARHFGVSAVEILADRREKRIVQPRQIVCWLACELTPHATTIIGRYLNKDHTTVISARRKIDRLISEAHPIAEDVIILREKLKIETPKPYWGA